MIISSFIAQDIGEPSLKGSTSQAGSNVTITAGGADIWGGRDEFHFAHIVIAGDFELTAQLPMLEMADTYTKAGLMLRASLEADAPHAMLLTFGDNQPRNRNNGALEFQSRLVAGGECSGIYPPQPLPQKPDFPASFPNQWLKLSRKGDALTGHFSTDGHVWKLYCSFAHPFPRAGLLGLAVTSHNEAKTVRAEFSNVGLIAP